MQKNTTGSKASSSNGHTQVGKPDDINPNVTSVFGSRIPTITPKNFTINIQEDGPSSKKGNDLLEIMPIGAGNEVGRSCVVMKYKGKTVMFDCGIHPGYTGLSALPYFDLIDPSSVDLLLVTHFHLDHCGGLPYFMEKTSFKGGKGKVFMTHPTKAIYKMLLSDYVKVSNIAVEEVLYDEQDLVNSMERIETLNYHQEIEHKGIKIRSYNAGHVLGAAMFMVEIAGVKILYTGDFSRQEDRHLMAAEIPNIMPDILIVESTYGVHIHESRQEREKRFTGTVRDIVFNRSGKCLIPVFALGRAQELLLILDEYWQEHQELQNIPIYYASTLAKKCMTIYQTYINMMNERIRAQITVSNPFVFKYIRNLRNAEVFEESESIGPCVVLASPGMLQNGLSRELLEKWCSDKKNGVIIPGYCVDGTLAKVITTLPSTITTSTGQTTPLNLSVDTVAFSAHSDFLQTSEFIDILQPPYIVLVHGDAGEMGRLKQSLLLKYENKNIEVFSPKNGHSVAIPFTAEKLAKAVGRIAGPSTSLELSDNTTPSILSGLLIAKDFNHHIMDPADLNTYTQMNTSSIAQNLIIPFPFGASSLDILKNHLIQMYDSNQVSDSNSEEQRIIKVSDAVSVIFNTNKPTQLLLEWISDSVSDMIADSIMSLSMQLDQK